jgi:hypothetical protein
MATPESVKTKIQRLIDTANATTGSSSTNLTTSVNALISGFNGKAEQEKSVDITVNNSTTEVVPDDGKVLSKVTVNVGIIGAPPESALFIFADYNDLGYPTTLIYNCPNTETMAYLFSKNADYQGSILQYIKKVVIPESTTILSAGTFLSAWSLEEVSNWDNITYIGDGCFSLSGGFTGTGNTLQYTYFPPNLTYIGKTAFRKNLDVISGQIPDDVTYIGDNAFAYGGNSNWEITKLPSNLTYIGASAF